MKNLGFKHNFTLVKLLIHLLFWALFIAISLVFVSSDKHWYQNSFFKYLAIVLLITYANNTIVLPFFLRKKAYVFYALLLIILSFLATVTYCNLISSCNCNLEFCLSKYLWQTMFPLLFLSFISLVFRFFEKQKELEQSRADALAIELKFLKSQLNPHILFNNLNTLYSYALEGSSQVPEMILNISNSLKYVLNESENHQVSLAKDLEYIDNYMHFMTIRSEGLKRITYKKVIPNNSFTIAPLLLISIIENAFKHSAKHRDIPSINITIRLEKNELILSCKNDFDGKQKKDSTGIGLVNLKKRLALRYKDKHHLTIKKESHSYSVILKLILS